MISSGKGGVGKSNVSANLASVFNDLGFHVALIDCDIYGSSIPNLFNITKYPPLVDNILYPAQVKGIDIVSVDFLMQAKVPIIWRGPMLNRALNHFFYYTKYQDDVNVVIIDLPPGTGDVALDVAQFMPNAYQLIVTTPHIDAADIAIKAGQMAQQMNQKLIGVIENMSYYEYEGKKLDIFGIGGGDIVANRLNVPLLCKIPIAKASDGAIFNSSETSYHIYEKLVKKIVDEVSFNK
jgi:ATP-binding protein involved in chromosome partitioning